MTAPTHAPGPAGAAPCASRRARRRRTAVLVSLLTAGASLVGTGAFASWSTTSALAGGSASAPLPVLTLSAGTYGASLTTAVANLVPGDYYYRYVDVANPATTGPSTQYSAALAGTGPLTGMTAAVDACPAAWTASATAGSGAGTCAGTTSALLADTPLGASGAAVQLAALAPGGVQHLRLRLALPAGAAPSLAALSGTLTTTVTGTTLPGTDRTNG